MRCRVLDYLSESVFVSNKNEKKKQMYLTIFEKKITLERLAAILGVEDKSKISAMAPKPGA